MMICKRTTISARSTGSRPRSQYAGRCRGGQPDAADNLLGLGLQQIAARVLWPTLVIYCSCYLAVTNLWILQGGDGVMPGCSRMSDL